MADPSYTNALLDATLPAGTSVEVAYRGLQTFTPQPSSCDPTKSDLGPIEDAATIDLYGDHYDDACIPAGEVADHNPDRQNEGMAFVGGHVWKDDANAIQGASYFQLRLTIRSNIATGRTPSVATLGIAWYE